MEIISVLEEDFVFNFISETVAILLTYGEYSIIMFESERGTLMLKFLILTYMFIWYIKK